MDQGLVFWEKYFKSQIEVTWDEFEIAFSKLLLDYGKIHLDETQLLYLKSLLDPDYRNIVKVAHFLIFQDTVKQKYPILIKQFWKVQSKKQSIFKHQFKTPVFTIPNQNMAGLTLKILQIASGYDQGERDIFIDRLQWTKTTYPKQTFDPDETSKNPYLQSIYIVQTPQEEFTLKKEEIFILGSSNIQSDFVIKSDIQMNPAHLKFVWTPNNIYLVKDIAKSFRTTLRIQPQQYYLLDYQNVFKLGPETSFFIRSIQPLPQFKEEMLYAGIRYIETAQEHIENYFPYLIKQLSQHRFSSVTEYRHAVDTKEIQTPNSLLSKSQIMTQSTFNNNSQLSQIKEEYYNKQQQLSESQFNKTGPLLVIEFSSGILKGKTFELDVTKRADFIIGKSKECFIQVADHLIQNEQIKIIYNQDYGWLIEHLETQDKNDTCYDQTMFGTFLLLANKMQLEQGLPSKAHVVQEGMVFNIGPYLFEAQYKSNL